jgi:Putative addiction module component
MNPLVDHLIDEALGLPPDERWAMALVLLDSLIGEDEAAVSAAWTDEIHRSAR